jgi:5-methylcytosine-specific restriction enzyme A
MPTITLMKKKPREVTINKAAYQAVYNTTKWKRLRRAKIKANPLCEECEKKGITTVAAEVHHIIPFDIGNACELAYDYDNLISLCVECHKEAHAKMHQPISHFTKNVEYR